MGGGKRRRKNSDKRPKEDDKKTRKEADFVATNSTIHENKKDSNDNTELGAQSKDDIDQMMLDSCNLQAVYNFTKTVPNIFFNFEKKPCEIAELKKAVM